VHDSDFQLGEVTCGLRESLCDKFFGGRETALQAIGDAVRNKKLQLTSIVHVGCQLTLHGVGQTPLRPLLIRVTQAPGAAGGQAATRHAQDRRPVEPRVEVSSLDPSANAEGEDQLWRHALEEARAGHSFQAYISDTDFKEAALVLVPQQLFPDSPRPGRPGAFGRIFVAPVDRSAPQTTQYWSMNEFVTAVATLPALVDAIPSGSRGRCPSQRAGASVVRTSQPL